MHRYDVWVWMADDERENISPSQNQNLCGLQSVLQSSGYRGV